jgi:hypothetical protein
VDINKPDHVSRIIANLLIGGRPVQPDAKLDPCVLCGQHTTHADSLAIDDERKHFTCREMVREDGLRTMIVQQDAISLCEALGKDGILFRRLEKRLEPYLRDVNADKLCRMITLSVAEIDRDPSIRPLMKQYIKGWLMDIRDRYIPSTN